MNGSVSVATGELMDAITVADVDASIERVIRHAESIWDEWAWQVENRTWLIKGYHSWDEMRAVEYTNLAGVTAPRAERPELIARFRNAGLTQIQTAETLGVSHMTVRRNDPAPAPSVQKNTFEHEEVLDAAIVEEVAPRSAPTRSPGRDLEIINDIRLYLRHIATEPEVAQLPPIGKRHIINALRDTATALERTER